MKGQMDIFDFVEDTSKKPMELQKQSARTLFERIFTKVDNPIMRCANCLCQYCVNNVEEVWHTVKPEEMQEPCFNCGECFEYDHKCRIQVKRNCGQFVLSDYGAKRNRKRIRIIRN